MVGMVVVGPVRKDEVGPEAADEPDQLPPRCQRRQQLAVVVVEHVIGRADDGAGGAGLGAAAPSQVGAVVEMVAGAAVGDADELDLAAETAPFGGEPPALRSASSGWAPRMRMRGSDIMSLLCGF